MPYHTIGQLHGFALNFPGLVRARFTGMLAIETKDMDALGSVKEADLADRGKRHETRHRKTNKKNEIWKVSRADPGGRVWHTKTRTWSDPQWNPSHKWNSPYSWIFYQFYAWRKHAKLEYFRIWRYSWLFQAFACLVAWQVNPII